jgi:hypothetical protein
MPTRSNNPARNMRFEPYLPAGIISRTRPQAYLRFLSGMDQNWPVSIYAVDFGTKGYFIVLADKLRSSRSFNAKIHPSPHLMKRVHNRCLPYSH